jgi:hypothetical protein
VTISAIARPIVMIARRDRDIMFIEPPREYNDF